jgi:hypothetical protein
MKTLGKILLVEDDPNDTELTVMVLADLTVPCLAMDGQLTFDQEVVDDLYGYRALADGRSHPLD